ncbi:zinc finger protein 260-like [Maniola hyperantus]|uniref:zinc finger protein 260-like n=1 Tax=Aphantopus hyperantus TaxID=2795564 RepID=UPI001568FBA5|nr:zinc finger Y-chromosomal protein 1-like [Maniola hyperantus]
MDSEYKKKLRLRPSKPRFIFEEDNEFIKREPVRQEKRVVYPVINIDVVKEELNGPKQYNNDIDLTIETNLANQVKVLNTFVPGTASITKHYKITTNGNDQSYIVPQLIENNSCNDTQNVEIKTEPEPFAFVDITENRVKVEDDAIKIENDDTIVPLATDKDSYLTNCEYCKFKAKDVLQLVAHIHNSHFQSNQTSRVREVKKGFVACDHCEFQTSGLRYLIIHIKAKHMPRNHSNKPLKYPCDFCDEKFSTKRRRFEHTKCHDGTGLSRECSHRYWKLNKGHQELKFFCNLCQHRACSKSMLDQHLLKNHRMKTIAFKCNHCQASFTKKINLIAHLKAQADNLTGYKCSSKNVKKSNRYNDFTFDYDMYVTKGKKNIVSKFTPSMQYECTKCPYMCSQKQHLKAHMDKHINTSNAKKTYKCRYCKFTYSTHTGLDQHVMKNHPHERPYFCKLCDCKYSLMNDLVKHIRSHFGRD